MARTLKSDKWLLWATMLLLGFSLVMVYSASAVWSMDKFQSAYHIFTKQAIWIAVGMAMLLIAMRVDYHFYKKPFVIWTALGLALLLLVAVFGFPKINDTRRWMNVGGFTLQPSEFAKLAAIFFTAALLERRMHRINEPKYALLPIGIVAGVLTGLIVLEPDFGTSAALAGVVLVMVFTAGLSYRHLAAVLAVLVPVAAVVAALEPYRVRRFMAFLDPGGTATGDSFQLNQAIIAVGSGGPLGRGLMEGVQKLGYIPEPHSDFIYAIIGEELGLIGATAIVVCFCIIAIRGVRAAMHAPDRYGALLATGLTAMIAGQAFVNISVVLGLVPTKGIPLPFVSYGGSSMIASLIGMGILLNITQHATSLEAGGRVRREAHTTADPLGVAG
ncbi:MAG TPA: putative lipid II flippase FtsW [Vicinamibacterales bacterium]|nr:putative lipid II flippase FtsW [Vicinamibacterales bacterium]